MAAPTAVSCCLVDHANARTLVAVFEKALADKDDAMIEKVTHCIGIHCRMHNSAVFEALLPLVGKLSKGGELSKTIKAKLVEIEQLLEAVDQEKKHLGNQAFVEAMQKQKQADSELMAMTETEVLPALMDELEEQELQAAAEAMEAAKLKAPLLPQAAAFA